MAVSAYVWHYYRKRASKSDSRRHWREMAFGASGYLRLPADGDATVRSVARNRAQLSKWPSMIAIMPRRQNRLGQSMHSFYVPLGVLLLTDAASNAGMFRASAFAASHTAVDNRPRSLRYFQMTCDHRWHQPATKQASQQYRLAFRGAGIAEWLMNFFAAA